MKEMLNDKAPGFYFALGSTLFSLITAILYAGLWGGTEYIAWGAFVFALLGAVLAAAALIIPAFIRFPVKKLIEKAAPWILFGCGIFGLALFIKAAYGYITRVSIGMDLGSLNAFSFGMPLFYAALFFLLNGAVATAALFLRIHKTDGGTPATKDVAEESPAAESVSEENAEVVTVAADEKTVQPEETEGTEETETIKEGKVL